MKKIIILITTLVLILSFSINSTAEDEKTKIVCTNTVLADFTSNIVKENVTITNIMPGGVCPAHFDTTPEQVSDIINADIIISLGWEPWLTKLSDKIDNSSQEQIKCLGFGEWNLPENAKKYVNKISTELIQILKEQNKSIKTNTQNYLEEINETESHLVKIIETMNYTNRKIIPMEWQKDFVEYLGLDVVTYYGPEEGLSTQDKLNISNAADNEEVAIIIDNLQSGTEFGEQTAEQTGKIHVVFTNFPGGIENVDSYLDMIKYNTAELVKGIAKYDYKKENLDITEISNFEFQRNLALVIALISIISTILLFVMYKKNKGE